VRSALDEVVQETTDAGHAVPCTKIGTVVALPVLMATIATVLSVGLWNAITETLLGGVVPATSTRLNPRRTNRAKPPTKGRRSYLWRGRTGKDHLARKKSWPPVIFFREPVPLCSIG
jgi:hypothetical protein